MPLSEVRKRFHEFVNEQISNEFCGAHQYIAIAIYFDSINMPQTANVFYQHAEEERDHAMRFVQYLLNRGLQVELSGVDDVLTSFTSVTEALKLAVDREKLVTTQIFTLVDVAREDKDHFGFEFMQWFVREQIEEETLFGTLLDVWRSYDNRAQFETYVKREVESAHAPGAPQVAGKR